MSVEIVNLDLEGALEAVLEEMCLLEDEEIWEEISLDEDPFPMLDPVWLDEPQTFQAAQ